MSADAQLQALLGVAHTAWHLMEDSGELAEEDLEEFHGDYVHLKLDHQKLSDALDALEDTGWDAHPEHPLPPSAGHQLLDRLALTADDLDELHPDSPVASDIRMAISRVRLAEQAAHEGLAARCQIRTVPNGGGTDG